MKISSILLKIGGSFTWIIKKIFSWEFLFGIGLTWGTRFFRFFGLIAFITTFIVAGKTAMNVGGTELDMLGTFGLEVVKDIITTDQYIYERALDFNNITSPTLWEGLTTSFLILKSAFYYVWWFRILRKGIQNFSWTFPFKNITKALGTDPSIINESTPNSLINWTAFKLLYILIILSNISYMIWISKEITFTFLNLNEYVGLNMLMAFFKNAFHFIDTLLVKHWWHWIVAFKGISVALFVVLYKTALLLIGTKIGTLITSNSNITR